MVNKVILIGNLGKDPEMSYTASGVAVTKVSLATNERWTSASGEKQERTEWHNLVFWRKSAEIANEYLRKGSKIYVEGKINYRSWEGNDGQKKFATDIVVDNFQILTPRSEGGGGGDYGGGGGQRSSGGQRQQQQGGGGGGARQRSRQQQQEGPYYEPIDENNQGGGSQGGGGGDFGGADDDDLPF